MQISNQSETFDTNGEKQHGISTIIGSDPEDILEISVDRYTPEIKKTTIESINLRRLPIGWQALQGLGSAINWMKDSPIESQDLTAIKPPTEIYFAIPMVASVIANNNNPQIPVMLPKKIEIEKIKPWLWILDKFIGKFSENLSEKFGNYIEKKGQNIVTETGTKIYKVSERIRTIEHPQEQFITELEELYRHITEPQYTKYQDFWGDEVIEEIPMEDRVREIVQFFAQATRRIYLGGDPNIDYNERNRKSHRANYPILSICMYDIIDTQIGSLLEEGIVIATPEFLYGVETFLRQHNVSNIRPAPNSPEFDLFNPNTWTRAAMELIAPEKLERVKNGLPHVLSLIHKALPKSGSEFSKKLYEISENVCSLKAQGESDTRIAQNIFAY